MPRFHLNLCFDEELEVRDTEGANYVTLDDAYLAAFTGAAELWPELLQERRDPRRYSFDIVDTRGISRMKLPFMELLESCQPVQPKRPGNQMRSTRSLLTAQEVAEHIHGQLANLERQMSMAMDTLLEIKTTSRSRPDQLGG